MRAFVTGGTGFIGRCLVKRLMDDGHDVKILTRAKSSPAPGGAAWVRATLEDGVGALAGAMTGADVLFHLAAQVSFDPAKLPELLRVNAEGTRTVLEAAKIAGVARSVVVSSACTIGLSHSAQDILNEDTPLDEALTERNPYLKSKHLAERYALDAHTAGQWVTIVNPTTVYGPGDDTLNSGTLVRQVASAGVLPVPSGGSNVVDVEDVALGIMAAADKGEPGRRYILGGANLTFREIFDRIADAVGRRPVFVSIPRIARAPMIAAAWFVQRMTGSRLITPQIVADTFAYKFYSSERAKTALGWRATRGFATTLENAWRYYRKSGLIAAPAGVAA